MYKAFGETVSAVAGATCLTFAFTYLLLGGSLNTMYDPNYISMANAAVTERGKPNPLAPYAVFQPLGWYCLPMSVFVFI